MGRHYSDLIGLREQKECEVVDADIMGEKRRIYEWILESLYSVTGKIGG